MRCLIDCDPGADDVLALLFALQRVELDVQGIVTVAGNVPLEEVTANACGVVELTGRNLPVCAGSDRPLVKGRYHASEVHGESGIGPLKLPQGLEHRVNTNFIDFYMEKLFATEEKTTIIALGPLTNVALLLRTRPEAMERIQRIVFMGGAYGTGNVTPFAEFNAYVDPEAYKIVFDSGLPVTMVGLDATHETLISPQEIANLRANTPESTFIKDLLTWYCHNVMTVYGYAGAHMHDPSAIMMLVHPEIFRTFDASLTISTQEDYTRAHILVDRSAPRKNVTVTSGLDNEAFKSIFFHTLEKYLSKEDL